MLAFSFEAVRVIADLLPMIEEKVKQNVPKSHLSRQEELSQIRTVSIPSNSSRLFSLMSSLILHRIIENIKIRFVPSSWPFCRNE